MQFYIYHTWPIPLEAGNKRSRQRYSSHLYVSKSHIEWLPCCILNMGECPLDTGTIQRELYIFWMKVKLCLIGWGGAVTFTFSILCNQRTLCIIWMASALGSQPSVLKMLQSRCSAWDPEASGDHWSCGFYFSNFNFPGASARYGSCIVALVQAGSIYLCIKYPDLEFFNIQSSQHRHCFFIVFFNRSCSLPSL